MLRSALLGFAVVLFALAPRAIDAAPGAPTPAAVAEVRRAADAAAMFSREAFPAGELGTIDSTVFEMALAAASCAVASGAVEVPGTLTVIDYSLPSSQKRLWVYDLKTRALLYEELVAHGQGSGANLATKFSNRPESHQTSLGLFVADETYVGKNGYSLRLDGLDKGVNDRARDRAIVMHGAPYVSPAFVKANGRLGRSHGCPAVSDLVARPLIDRVKGGGLVFAYYPDPDFLERSKFISGCAR